MHHRLKSLRTEYGAKIAGAQALLAHTCHQPLAGLNLFSSLAAFSGSGGQAMYASANGALDAYASALQVGRARLMPLKTGVTAFRRRKTRYLCKIFSDHCAA